jgi:hypothetical protein
VWLTFEGNSWHFDSCQWVVVNSGKEDEEVVLVGGRSWSMKTSCAPRQLRHHPFAAVAPISLAGPAAAVRLPLHLESFDCECFRRSTSFKMFLVMQKT